MFCCIISLDPDRSNEVNKFFTTTSRAHSGTEKCSVCGIRIFVSLFCLFVLQRVYRESEVGVVWGNVWSQQG